MRKNALVPRIALLLLFASILGVSWIAYQKLLIYPRKLLNEIKAKNSESIQITESKYPLATKYKIPICAELNEQQGTELKCSSEKIRIYRPLSEISKLLQDSVVMMEDAKFFMHKGLDLDEIKNAMEADLKHGKFKRGASTITQQLSKNLFLSKEKSIFRKLKEIPIVMKLEKELTKKQILELYLNVIEWGPGIFGAEAASRYYFDIPAAKLNQYQAWLLTLMIPNPKELNLWEKPKAIKSITIRAQTLANRLVNDKLMDQTTADTQFNQFIGFVEHWQVLNPKKNLPIYQSRTYKFEQFRPIH